MSETRWTYYDPNKGIQQLGLYHGQDSGNVVIYHNQSVVVVDFMVHKSKSYSFMVNKYLVKLNLLKENGKFDYKFEREQVKAEIPNEAVPLSNKVMTFLSRPFR